MTQNPFIWVGLFLRSHFPLVCLCWFHLMAIKRCWPFFLFFYLGMCNVIQYTKPMDAAFTMSQITHQLFHCHLLQAWMDDATLDSILHTQVAKASPSPSSCQFSLLFDINNPLIIHAASLNLSLFLSLVVLWDIDLVIPYLCPNLWDYTDAIS